MFSCLALDLPMHSFVCSSRQSTCCCTATAHKQIQKELLWGTKSPSTTYGTHFMPLMTARESNDFRTSVIALGDRVFLHPSRFTTAARRGSWTVMSSLPGSDA